jgi:DNA-binding NarL/FixJ family response regulator
MSKWKSKNNKPKFTPESTFKMVSMVKQGKKISEISKEIGLTDKTIKTKLWLLGWSYEGLL